MNTSQSKPNPQGAVLCPKCAARGKRTEMHPCDELEQSYLATESCDTPEGLRSYRCPQCEHIETFKVD